ncbi:LysR family transcriptional regulator [Labrenzia sp. 011]|uniref:LysR substrate-binding domain-containing protein n=1 Tax=Labrenzia sp. 011 TaxID=2171494 RepID=UPI000D5183BF|nr:LysR family transcriptional regulator [Labrenzia sp. 011]PVB61579.1 LysR family transcriptional regulator [Labrenzia sp. 011]
MDRLETMRLFVRVVERGSFSRAASDMNIPRSTATEAVQRLEKALGSRLLERTTRHVAPTPDGETYYRRCVAILADLEEAEGALRGHEPSGLLRVDAPGTLTRVFLLPHLSGFFERYPGITLQLGQSERLVDLVREGVDCVLRAGDPDDSGMIMRKLASLPEITCASPAYLQRFGTPASVGDLAGHRMVGFLSSRTGAALPLEFQTGDRREEITLPATVIANDADTTHHLARQGFGLIQAPRYRFREDLAAGRLVEVLPDTPPPPLPLAAFYPQNRQLSPRVRVFLDWIVGIFARAEM